MTCLNWIAWFPFLLFDTDWMGKEVYGGKTGEGTTAAEKKAYDMGVHAGALGLMINSVVLGVVSLGIERLARAVGGVKRLWGIVNLILAVCLAMTVLVTKSAEHHRAAAHLAGATLSSPPAGVKSGALAIFGVLGIPLAVINSFHTTYISLVIYCMLCFVVNINCFVFGWIFFLRSIYYLFFQIMILFFIIFQI